MSNLVVLSFGSGDLQSGFSNISVSVWESNNSQPTTKFTGSLPAALQVAEIYEDWKSLYLTLYLGLGANFRIEINSSTATNISTGDINDFSQRLSNSINDWLNSEPFRDIEQQLRTQLERGSEIRFIIETNDPLLRRLPWHQWRFFQDYSSAEVALSASQYQRANKRPAKLARNRIRILAVFGSSQGINVSKDRELLEQLENQAEVEFLIEPQLDKLHYQLWNNWDILFFGGHSSSRKEGVFQLNLVDSLTISSLKNSLKKAISCGLKLAIFNSCDGLGLAQALEELHIPQVIVMREPVPDVVAQEFLRHFLASFSGGQSLYASVREAREKLEALENKYPCASWLPVLCQNPAEPPTSWQDWSAPTQNHNGLNDSSLSSSLNLIQPKHRTRRSLLNKALKVLLTSAIATASVMGVRYLGALQSWELQAYDQLIQLRPDEKPDPRLTIVAITENDVREQNSKYRNGSISDWALNKALEILHKNQARTIGLDIYRDHTPRADLANQLRNENFVGVCKVRDTTSGEAGTGAPPEMPLENQGFSDTLEDPDRGGTVRRYLYYLTPDPGAQCRANYALSMQVALRYLASIGILPKVSPSGFLQVGDVVFKPLENHTGGYQQIDAWGYQILMNYRSSRGPQNVAAQINLMQLLKGQFDPKWVKDRVVLIGTTAGSFQDFWHTPYINGPQSARSVPGVLVQAQIVSQILSTVLDHRPLLSVWPLWGEVLWVWGWSVVGGILVWRIQHRLGLGLAFVTTSGVMYGLCFGLLLKCGYWVPLVPSAIALIVTGGITSVIIYTARNKRKIHEKNYDFERVLLADETKSDRTGSH